MEKSTQKWSSFRGARQAWVRKSEQARSTENVDGANWYAPGRKVEDAEAGESEGFSMTVRARTLPTLCALAVFAAISGISESSLV